MRASSRADEGFAPHVTRLRRRRSSVRKTATGASPAPPAQDATSKRTNGPQARFTAFTGSLSFAVPTPIQRRRDGGVNSFIVSTCKLPLEAGALRAARIAHSSPRAVDLLNLSHQGSAHIRHPELHRSLCRAGHYSLEAQLLHLGPVCRRRLNRKHTCRDPLASQLRRRCYDLRAAPDVVAQHVFDLLGVSPAEDNLFARVQDFDAFRHSQCNPFSMVLTEGDRFGTSS